MKKGMNPAEFISFKIKIKGVERFVSRLNRIIGNLDFQTDKISETLMKNVKTEAQNIIRSRTSGTGELANGMIIKKEKGKQGSNVIKKWVLTFDPAVARYSKPVHNGFTSHWVHKDMIADWLALHPKIRLRYGKWLEVGYPKTEARYDGTPKQSASWLPEGGTKFFVKAYDKILRNAKSEYNKVIKNALRGK